MGFFKTFFEEFPFDGADPVYKQNSVEVVYLMVQGYGEESVAFYLELLPCPVPCPHHNLFSPLDLRCIFRKAQASLLEFNRAFPKEKLRVYKNNEGYISPFCADVDNGEPFCHTHLRGGKPDARGRVHGLYHIVDKGLKVLVEGCDRRGLLLQH